MKSFQSDVPAFYHPLDVMSGERIVLSEEEARHARAHRLRPGDDVRLLDGAGGRAEGKVVELDRKEIAIAVESVVLEREEGLPYIGLAAGILSDKSRYEWCLEKGVELGLREFIPLLSERSEGRFNAERAHRVAVAALKQSQRAYLPALHDPVSLDMLTGRFGSFHSVFFCHEDVSDENSLARFLKASPASGRTLILIGPEGGFSADELRRALDAGATAVSLGSARLRAETAAVAALVLVGSLSSA
jgi:16S rRNA (uracil1498-N3)-methyltransferase